MTVPHTALIGPGFVNGSDADVRGVHSVLERNVETVDGGYARPAVRDVGLARLKTT